eukprot:1157997-Pelagomonas_calceolata.AAC.1
MPSRQRESIESWTDVPPSQVVKVALVVVNEPAQDSQSAADRNSSKVCVCVYRGRRGCSGLQGNSPCHSLSVSGWSTDETFLPVPQLCT